MFRTITTERLPILLWLDRVDDDTLQQARNLANHPAAFHHIALMPDAHVGYGMPIGGVMAARDQVLPNAVGVDIGCGVCGVKTSLAELATEQLKKLLGSIRAAIPLGFKHHLKPLPETEMPELTDPAPEGLPIVEREWHRARAQLGTLGGGNHFIEFQRGRDQRIWFMVHSGSRNLGYQVANHYNRLAADGNARSAKPLPASWQLAALPDDSPEGRRYLAEMEYCVRFAEANRTRMARVIADIIRDQLGREISFEAPLNIAHNYAAREVHFGRAVYVHRKGAIRALTGEVGIIPGSQGSRSYIVRGLGNPESFSSCSHGAGRKLGRKQARKVLDLDRERHQLEAQNILHALRSKRDLEEATGAYKDIDAVVASQADLVEVVEILSPLAVIKG